MGVLQSAEREIRNYGNSFTPNMRFVKIFSICLIFVFVLFLCSMGWQGLYGLQSDNVMNEYYEVGSEKDIGQLKSFVGSFQLFLLYMGVASVGFLVIFFLGWGITKTLVWGEILGFKFSKRLSLRCALLKFCWQLIWLPLNIIFIVPLFMFASALQTKPSLNVYVAGLLYFNILIFLIIAYFGMFMYYSFFKNKKIYLAITEAFKNGFIHLKSMLLPLLLIVLSLIVMYLIAKYLIPLIFLNLFMALYLTTALQIYFICKLKDIIK